MTSTPPSAGQVRRGLLIDFGNVLTTSVFASFAAFGQAQGLDPLAVSRLLREDLRAVDLVARLETGELPDAVFESEFAALLGVKPEGLIGRMLAGTGLERRMIDAVRALRRAGVRTALVSNSWGLTSYPEALLNDLFDEVVISAHVGLRKPDPEIYRLAACKVGLDPAECVFVDDLPSNLVPAEQLAMGTIRHTDPAATIAQLERIFGIDLAGGTELAGSIELTGTDAGPVQPR